MPQLREAGYARDNYKKKSISKTSGLKLGLLTDDETKFSRKKGSRKLREDKGLCRIYGMF